MEPEIVVVTGELVLGVGLGEEDTTFTDDELERIVVKEVVLRSRCEEVAGCTVVGASVGILGVVGVGLLVDGIGEIISHR